MPQGAAGSENAVLLRYRAPELLAQDMKMEFRMDDGSKAEFGPGDVGSIPPGHDAWTVGNEPFVCIDFQGAQCTPRQVKLTRQRSLSRPLCHRHDVHWWHRRLGN
jgi:hypothetical protein